MPTWVKWMIGLGVIGMLTVGACILGGIFWFKNNVEDVAVDVKNAAEEARRFGADADEDKCVSHYLPKISTCDTFELRCISTHLPALAECLAVAKPSDGFCQRNQPEAGIIESALFRKEFCGKYGKEDSASCAQALNVIETHCRKGSDADTPVIPTTEEAPVNVLPSTPTKNADVKKAVDPSAPQ